MDLSWTADAPTKHQRVAFRPINKINLDIFKNDLSESDLKKHPSKDLSGLCTQYTDTLSSLLDKHAPLSTKKIVLKAPSPWMTAEILKAKTCRRQLERVWRRSRSAYDRSKYTQQSHLCNRLMTKAKNAYYTSLIAENENKPHRLWNSINKILHRQPCHTLPENGNINTLCELFSDYFVKKIKLIRDGFHPHPSSENEENPHIISPLVAFTPASEAEVTRLILSSPTKSCDLDPIPTCLLKACIDTLIVPITQIINLSLTSGTVPANFKEAHVKPLLKKPSLDKNNMKNYRPISNLPFKNSRESSG